MIPIRIAHGGGGRETAALIHSVIQKRLGNPVLDRLEDGAVLEGLPSPLVFTTDSFVVQPLFFPGGDIGKLSVCGTVNDLAVMGAEPKYLSLALIIEEGFATEDLERIIDSVAATAREAGVTVVCGDTKVVEKGGADGLFINTAGLGARRPGIAPSISAVRPGDILLVNGPVGDHAVAVLGARKKLNFTTALESDCAPLHSLAAALFDSGVPIHAMRDATRGGLSAVMNEMALASNVTMVVDEKNVPVRDAVRAACGLLGFNPFDLANEGKLVVAAPAHYADRLLDAMRAHPLGREAAVVGCVEASGRFPAVLETRFGGRIILEMPRGELLPRIC
ncbi:MAG: hydrogenase expression/formation protein HypE [Fibrobacterota bacterium]